MKNLHNAKTATDVTGFGILGHAQNLSEVQNINISIHSLPIFDGLQIIAEEHKYFKFMEGFSSETSGGLLIVLSRKNASVFLYLYFIVRNFVGI